MPAPASLQRPAAPTLAPRAAEDAPTLSSYGALWRLERLIDAFDPAAQP